MYSQAHSELSAIRPSMALAIGHGVPALCALAIGALPGMIPDAAGMDGIVLSALFALLLVGGVDADELVKRPDRAIFIVVTSAVKGLAFGAILSLLILATTGRAEHVRVAAAFTALYVPALSLGSAFLVWLALRPAIRRPAVRVVIVGVTDASLQLARTMRSDPFVSAQFLGFYEDRRKSRLPAGDYRILGTIKGMADDMKTRDVDEVFIALTAAGERRMEDIFESLLDSAASVHYLHDYSGFKPIHECVSWVNDMPVHTVIGRPDAGVSGAFKRCFDVFGAFAGLIVLSPLLLLVAALIKLESSGPVLFRQQRYGAEGRPFWIYKFRSMTTDACAAKDVVQATANDARVTRLGRILRKSSIDELPQLINVLRGEMSLVGPRPHAAPHNEHYRGLIRGYMMRHKARPGLTGWAQIHGLRGETETVEKMEKRVSFDLDYLRNWSLSLDIYIVLCTFRQLVKGV